MVARGFAGYEASPLRAIQSKADGEATMPWSTGLRNVYDRVLTWVRKRCTGPAMPKR
jgi:hypothetical protein